MCGRVTLTTSAEIVAEAFDLVDVPELSPRYNIAPTQPASVVRMDQQNKRRRFDQIRWGLIPSWAKEAGVGARMINARAETVAQKPAFRTAFQSRRCLVVADGFYEWQKQPGSKRKQPYYIQVGSRGPFALAGIWERWAGPQGTAIDSCSIITTEPNELMKRLHDRMPVILQPRDYALWLDADVQERDSLQRLLVPYPPGDMSALAVHTFVNNPSHDTPACIKPVE